MLMPLPVYFKTLQPAVPLSRSCRMKKRKGPPNSPTALTALLNCFLNWSFFTHQISTSGTSPHHPWAPLDLTKIFWGRLLIRWPRCVEHWGGSKKRECPLSFCLNPCYCVIAIFFFVKVNFFIFSLARKGENRG
jgi:hypothetical protein